MRIIECEQNTPEWHAARCGKITGSRVADIVRKVTAGKESKMRATYAGELVAERLSGVQAPGFASTAMEHGHATENEAAETYGFTRGVSLLKVGFATHPVFDLAGCSPDRLIGSDGMIEVKCPNSATHIETLLGSAVAPDYIKQMQWQMACCERQWCDFVSYDPRMPPDMQLHVQRFGRDDVMIRELEGEVVKFLAEVAAKVDALLSKFRRDAA